MLATLHRSMIPGAAVAALALTLTACAAGSDEQTPVSPAPEAEVSSAAPSADTSPEPTAAAEGSEALEAHVASEAAALPELMELYNGLYEDISISAEGSDTIVYDYVFAEQIDPIVAEQTLDATSAELERTVAATLFPAMAGAGVGPQQQATYTYSNPDGTELWSQTYTSE